MWVIRWGQVEELAKLTESRMGVLNHAGVPHQLPL